MLLHPTVILRRVSDITPELLSSLGVKALMLDIDNTLTTHGNPQPTRDAYEWIASLRKNGISAILVSNNNEERVRPFAGMLGLDFISGARKPLHYGMKRALEKLGTSKESAALVGDQIFTDVLGGNLYGVKTILLEPIEPEKGLFFLMKRTIERPILRRIRK